MQHIKVNVCLPFYFIVVLQTIAFADFVAAGGEKRAKELGKVRFEGTSYVVQDGDIILFHHRK